MTNNLEDLIHKRISRRGALKGLAFFTAGAILPGAFFNNGFARTGDAAATGKTSPGVFFEPIPPSSADEFILAEGFDYKIIRQWGDMISDTEIFGYNNDYVVYLPIDVLEGGNNSDDGILFVNNEYTHPVFVSGYNHDDYQAKKPKTKEQIVAEKKSVGVSIFRVKKGANGWEFVNDSKYNNRIDATVPVILSGKAAGTPEMHNSYEAIGTLANCSGGLTPWGTVLSGEENFQDCMPGGWYKWDGYGEELIPEHYGWILEVDPFDKTKPAKKRTSMGRFHHENVCIGIAKDGRVAAYMGDDDTNECVYKFVSSNKFDPSNREANMDILDDGDLYVADFVNNKWQLLDFEKREELKKDFKSQADVLINCDKSSKLVGGTESNRPEDIEIHPVDGSVYIAFTNNSKKKDYHGSIVRIIEAGDDHAAEYFTWEVFATGSVESGFSCPDNLCFDSEGNLWVLSDMSGSKMNKGDYEPFKNNSLFFIPTQGENKGKAFRFASAPTDAEMCGGNFTLDEKTMFISIQHPGEQTDYIEKPTSRWPNGGNDIPRPAVIAITGFK
jgi:uncharacterized protein